MSLNTVSHFSTLDCWCEEKTSIPVDQVIKSVDTFQEKWKHAGWAPQIHNQYLKSQALVTPWSHFSIHCILSQIPRGSSKPPPMMMIWQWICIYPARPKNAEENQPITNLKPRNVANTTAASKIVKDFSRRLLFCSNLYDASTMI